MKPDEQQRHRYRKVYDSSRWRGPNGLRVQVLSTRPFCAICGLLASVVDHIRPHRGNEALAFDINNLRPLCNECHSRISPTLFRKAPR